MIAVTVTTQAELDEALASEVDRIYIRSASDVVLVIAESREKRVVACDSAHVDACGSAHVEACGSAHVDACGSAHVEACGSAHVEARGSAHVEAWNSAHVEARGSAYVEAWNSAHVEARDSAHVVARDSAHVVARDSAHVVAGTHVSVARKSIYVQIDGGVIIDHVAVDLNELTMWVGYCGVRVEDGDAILYKAVSPNLTTGEAYAMTTRWAVGTTVTAPDWSPGNSCGHGLHVSPSIAQAKSYRPSGEFGTRYLKVRTSLADLIPLGSDKAKARSVFVIAEVDHYGNELP